MEIGPIFRSMRANRVGVSLIALEIAISLALILNSVNLARAHLAFVHRPTGIDVPNIVYAFARHWDDSLDDPAFLSQQLTGDLETLRHIPGVIAASTSTHSLLSGSGSSRGFRPPDHPERDCSVGVWGGDEHLLEALGLKLSAGRMFTPEEVREFGTSDRRFELGRFPAVITQDLAETWFPDQNAVGQTVTNDDESTRITIVGVVERMAGSWPEWKNFYRNIIHPHYDSWAGCKYVIRVEPGHRDAIIPQIEKTLEHNYDHRFVTTSTLEEIRDRTFQNDSAIAKYLMGICGLLIFVNALGISGLTTFWVSQRRRMIGVRRALGAQKWHILRYFLLEISLICAMGVLSGSVIALAINRQFVAHFDLMPVLPISMFIPGILGVWFLGLASVIVPAFRATRIEPSIASRST